MPKQPAHLSDIAASAWANLAGDAPSARDHRTRARADGRAETLPKRLFLSEMELVNTQQAPDLRFGAQRRIVHIALEVQAWPQ